MSLDLRAKPETGCLIYAGDDMEITLLARTPAGQPVNLTGATIELRLHAWDGTAFQGAALISRATGGSGITLADPANGMAVVDLTSAQTEALPSGRYYVVTRVTTALGKRGTLQPFLAQVIQTPF